ncbi:ketopantoate reductase family protein [Tunturibacter empetritectus]|uniref:2-dehydropantoate 2-reductase n=1 Tax=Tunturiibacter lichenicola TaxID=2051959 RepID=A0A7W8J5U6_9BACT|nr:ketopantoate reductase family protein [Edaphobacter lichenicola]MBB5343091.1 2-dehydropantoate 2-reductase [Edaphobacter lichenicola]
MKILVVGAGAVGGYFGTRLAQAGRDVTFLVRPARAQQLQRDGLRILSPHGDATLKPKTITSSEITSPYDVIFLSVKAQALDQAIKDMTHAVGPDTMIYPVLNGMRHMNTLVQSFGEQAVLGGVCMVSTDLDEQGRIVQITPMQKLIYGERSGELTPRIRTLDAMFHDASFDTELSLNITQAMWDKWVIIASLGLITCLLGGPIGEINRVPDGEQTALQALEECAAIAKACGFPTPQPLLENLRKQATMKDSQFTSSMYRDLQKGTPVEVDTILGDLLDHGHAHHLEASLLQACCVRLRVYQNSLKAEKH